MATDPRLIQALDMLEKRLSAAQHEGAALRIIVAFLLYEAAKGYPDPVAYIDTVSASLLGGAEAVATEHTQPYTKALLEVLELAETRVRDAQGPRGDAPAPQDG